MKHIWLLFSIVPSLVLAQKAENEIRRGNKVYRAEDFAGAEVHYRKALEKDAESPKANYNLGNALYKQEQYEPAITKYENLAVSSVSKNQQAKYYYNLGNAFFQSQKFNESIEAYKKSLRINPDDTDAKHNLYLAQLMMNQQQQQNQKDDKNKDSQKKQNEEQSQDQDQKQKDKNQQQQQQQQQQQPGQISRQDAERLLEAIEQDEKETLKKIQERKMMIKKVPVEKEW